MLCFTAEEAWLARHGAEAPSIHRQQFPDLAELRPDPGLALRWAGIRDLRRVVTGAIELERAAKRIGSSLQASIRVHATADHGAALAGLDLAEIAIVSAAELIETPPPDGAFVLPDVPGVGVIVEPAPGEKCLRCWRVLPEVTVESGTLCGRCAELVAPAAPAGA